jgi:hypothetical protein
LISGKNGTFDEGFVAKVEYLSTMSQMQGDRYPPLAPKTLGETPSWEMRAVATCGSRQIDF